MKFSLARTADTIFIPFAAVLGCFLGCFRDLAAVLGQRRFHALLESGKRERLILGERREVDHGELILLDEPAGGTWPPPRSNNGGSSTSAPVTVIVNLPPPGPPVFSLSSSTYSVQENGGSVSVTVLKSLNSPKSLRSTPRWEATTT